MTTTVLVPNASCTFDISFDAAIVGPIGQGTATGIIEANYNNGDAAAVATKSVQALNP